MVSNGALLGAAGIGAVGNIAGGLISNAVGTASSKKLASLQAYLNYYYSKKAALESPSWNRQGLTDAGYNPMLAVQNATSGVNSSWTSASGVGSPDLGNLGTDAISNAQSFQRLNNETQTAQSQVEANNATAENQRADAANKREENPYISKRAKAEIGKLESETSYNQAAIENMQSRIELDRELGYLDASTKRYSADKGYSGTVYNADKMKQVADDHSPSGKSTSFRNYTGGVSDVLRAAGGFVPWYNTEDTYHVNSEGVVKGSKHKRTKRSRR